MIVDWIFLVEFVIVNVSFDVVCSSMISVNVSIISFKFAESEDIKNIIKMICNNKMNK